jgi:6-phosphogluconate dehydrogenase
MVEINVVRPIIRGIIMSRYEVRDDHGQIQIYDTRGGKVVCLGEAAELLNELMSVEEKKVLQTFAKNCDQKMSYELLDKTLEILMMTIMEQKNSKLVEVVEEIAKGGEAHWACANLLRRAIYLKALADEDEK